MKFTIKRNVGEVIDYTDPKNCAIARGLKSKGYVRVMVNPTSWVGQTAKGQVNFGLIPDSENQKAHDICLDDNVFNVLIILPRAMKATPKNIESVKGELDKIYSYGLLVYTLEMFGITN